MSKFFRAIGRFFKVAWEVAEGATEPAVITRAKIARARLRANQREDEQVG